MQKNVIKYKKVYKSLTIEKKIIHFVSSTIFVMNNQSFIGNGVSHGGYKNEHQRRSESNYIILLQFSFVWKGVCFEIQP